MKPARVEAKVLSEKCCLQCWIIKYGSALVPFINRFPKNTKLYQLMTTRPGEGRFAGQS